MSESLRDRVARVLGEAHTSDGRRAVPAGDTTARADALIAAGLVADPEWEYGFRKKDGGMSSPDARWRTPEQAEAWMVTTRPEARSPGSASRSASSRTRSSALARMELRTSITP